MAFVWDYDKDQLEKTEEGRLLLLERAVNYGPVKGEKIKLSQVKEHWKKLNLFPLNKRLFELLIWGKYRSSPRSKKLF